MSNHPQIQLRIIPQLPQKHQHEQHTDKKSHRPLQQLRHKTRMLPRYLGNQGNDPPPRRCPPLPTLRSQPSNPPSSTLQLRSRRFTKRRLPPAHRAQIDRSSGEGHPGQGQDRHE